MSNIALYRVLVGVGADKEEAQAAADSIPEKENLATKTDLLEAFGSCKDEISGVKTEIAVVKTEISELKIEIANSRADMHRTIWAVGLSINGTFLTAIAVGVLVLNRLLA